MFGKNLDIVKYEILKLMGLAKHRMLQNDEAGKLLTEAYEYNKEDEKAKCNNAWGHLFLNKTDEAKALAEEILDENPNSIVAHQIIVYSSDEDLDDIISKVPDSLKESKDIAYAIGVIARERKLFSESEEWLRIAIRTYSKGFPDFKGNLGEVILENLIKNPLIIYSNQISLKEKEKLTEARKLLQEAWEELYSLEIKKSRISWIVNKSTINRLLGNLSAALDDINKALELDPSDNSIILKKGLILDEIGEYDDSKGLIKDLNENEVPEKQIILAIISSNDKKYPEAIDILENFLEDISDVELTKQAQDLLIQLHITNKDPENAQKVHDCLFSHDTEDIFGLVYASRISTLKENDNESNSFLDKAIANISNSSSITELLVLANDLFNHERLEDAAKIYEKFVDKDIYTDHTCKLVDSYFRSGEIGKALQTCKRLREIYDKPLKFISEIEISIYNEIDNYRMAKELCDEYVRLFPSNIRMRINQAYINLYFNDLTSVDDFLNSDIKLDELSLDDFIRLSHLYQLRDYNSEIVLKILYELRRNYFNDIKAHAEYVSSIILSKVLNEFTPIRVELDTAFCLEENSGKRKWYVLEDREDVQLALDEISLEEPIGQKVLGKYLGEEVELENGPVSEKVKIVDIKSKYLYAHHKSLEYSKFFSPYGIYSLSIPESGEDKFKSILDMVTERQERYLELKNLYNAGKITTWAFAHLGGLSVADAWRIIIESEDLLLCNVSQTFDMDFLLSILEKKPRLIIDIISLLTIFKLNVQDELIETFGKFGIAQSTFNELLISLNAQEKFKGRESMSIVKIDDKFVINEIRIEEVKNRIETLKNMTSWVKENCEVLPCNAALELKREQRDKLNIRWGKSSVDSILIAKDPGNLLYCEEEIIRSVGKEQFGIRGVWTQVLLLKCATKHRIVEKEYFKAIDDLMHFGYFFIS